MKKIIAIITMAVTTLTGFNAEAPQEDKAQVLQQSMVDEVEIVPTNPSTELFVVQYVTTDGMLNAESLSEETNAPNGYLLDNKYELGDVVEVTYSHDYIISERKITGEELSDVYEGFEGELDALMDEGMGL